MLKIMCATERLLPKELSDFWVVDHYVIHRGAYAGLYTSAAITLFRHRLIIDIRTHANECDKRSAEVAAHVDRAANGH